MLLAQHEAMQEDPASSATPHLMLAGEALLVAGAVLRNVLRVRLGQALDGVQDGLHAALLAHALRAEVRVRARACVQAADVTVMQITIRDWTQNPSSFQYSMFRAPLCELPQQDTTAPAQSS